MHYTHYCQRLSCLTVSSARTYFSRRCFPQASQRNKRRLQIVAALKRTAKKKGVVAATDRKIRYILRLCETKRITKLTECMKL